MIWSALVLGAFHFGAKRATRSGACLIAYRTRGTVVLSTAVTSVVATVGISIMAVPDCVIRCGTRRGLNPVTSPGACRVRALSVGGQADAAVPPQSRGKPFGSGDLA